MAENPIDARGSCREARVEAGLSRDTKRRQLSEGIQPSGGSFHAESRLNYGLIAKKKAICPLKVA